MLIFLFINLKAPSWPLNLKGIKSQKPYLLGLLVFVRFIYMFTQEKPKYYYYENGLLDGGVFQNLANWNI